VQKTARSIPSWVGCRNAPPQEPSPSWSERFKGDRRQQGQRPRSEGLNERRRHADRFPGRPGH